ncbi:MAG: archaellin/type IV pilin N-terminal domain-containing protein [Candidatus Aenigmatarchaeota archaeon]
MKAITPVIATILLLLIAVAVAGYAFVFLSSQTSGVAGSTENALNAAGSDTRFSIENQYGAQFYIRNNGNTPIIQGMLTVYVDGAKINAAMSDNISSSSVGILNVEPEPLVSGKTIVIKGKNWEDRKDIKQIEIIYQQ